jgi:transcription termination/antitermination protein NusA
MEGLNLISTFAEFKELKNIDRPTMMSVLEDVFRNQLIKMYGTADNFDIIINIDKGDFEIWRNREVVEGCKIQAHKFHSKRYRKLTTRYEIGESLWKR